MGRATGCARPQSERKGPVRMLAAAQYVSEGGCYEYACASTLAQLHEEVDSHRLGPIRWCVGDDRRKCGPFGTGVLGSHRHFTALVASSPLPPGQLLITEQGKSVVHGQIFDIPSCANQKRMPQLHRWAILAARSLAAPSARVGGFLVGCRNSRSTSRRSAKSEALRRGRERERKQNIKITMQETAEDAAAACRPTSWRGLSAWRGQSSCGGAPHGPRPFTLGRFRSPCVDASTSWPLERAHETHPATDDSDDSDDHGAHTHTVSKKRPGGAEWTAFLEAGGPPPWPKCTHWQQNNGKPKTNQQTFVPAVQTYTMALCIHTRTADAMTFDLISASPSQRVRCSSC